MLDFLSVVGTGLSPLCCAVTSLLLLCTTVELVAAGTVWEIDVGSELFPVIVLAFGSTIEAALWSCA